MAIEGTTLDNIIHIITALLALVLFIISSFSYYRDKRHKFLYICAAFLLFAIKELVTGLNVLFYNSANLTAVTHLLNFIVLILFFIGVTK